MIELFQKYGLSAIHAAVERAQSTTIDLQAADKKSVSGPAFVYATGGMTGIVERKTKRSVRELKALSESYIPSRAIRLIRNGMTSLEYGLRPKIAPTPGQKNKYESVIDMVKAIFDQPNRDADDFGDFIGPIVEDLLVFDAACWEYVEKPSYLVNNDTMAMELVPGYSIQMLPKWDGKPKSDRWQQVLEYGIKGPKFKDSEIEYIMQRRRTWTAYGLSQLETAADIMDGVLGLTTYQRSTASNAYPAFIGYLGDDAQEDQVSAFRYYWENELKGRGTPGFFGGMGKNRPDVMNLKPVGDDGLYLRYFELLLRIVAFSFDLKPMDFNLERDVNRSTAEVTAGASVQEARVPIAQCIARRINSKVIPRIARLTGNKLVSDLEFWWLNIDPNDPQSDANVNSIYLDRDVMTIDEIRAELDLEPLPNGVGALTLTAYKGLVGMNPEAGLPPGTKSLKPAEPAAGENNDDDIDNTPGAVDKEAQVEALAILRAAGISNVDASIILQ